MTYRTQTLTLALVVTLALSALTASSAFAVEGAITPGSTPASLTGSQIGIARFVIGSAVTREVRCSVVTLASTSALSATTSSVSVKPTYSGCTTLPGEGSATVKVPNTSPNICTYSFTATEKQAGSVGDGSISIVGCGDFTSPESTKPESERIFITANSTAGSPICKYDIGSQGPLSRISWFSNSSDVRLAFALSGIKVHVSFGTLAACGASGGGSTIAALSGEITATADSGGTATSLLIS